jgi:O-acetyl-ADP-ribose deacetylase (regulator of RNase III)
MQVKVEGTTIEIIKGDITTQDTEAIVNSANNYLWMGSGVAGAIKKNGGVSIEEEATAQGPVRVGEAVITGAGSLPCRYVIHAATMGQDLKTDEEKIRQAVESTLNLMVEKKISSVAFPSFGTGVGSFPVVRSASVMIDTVLDYLLNKSVDDGENAIELIRFVLFDDAVYEVFKNELSARFSA